MIVLLLIFSVSFHKIYGQSCQCRSQIPAMGYGPRNTPSHSEERYFPHQDLSFQQETLSERDCDNLRWGPQESMSFSNMPCQLSHPRSERPFFNQDSSYNQLTPLPYGRETFRCTDLDEPERMSFPDFDFSSSTINVPPLVPERRAPFSSFSSDFTDHHQPLCEPFHNNDAMLMPPTIPKPSMFSESFPTSAFPNPSFFQSQVRDSLFCPPYPPMYPTAFSTPQISPFQSQCFQQKNTLPPVVTTIVDNTVSNALANSIQLLIVSNLLESTLRARNKETGSVKPSPDPEPDCGYEDLMEFLSPQPQNECVANVPIDCYPSMAMPSMTMPSMTMPSMAMPSVTMPSMTMPSMTMPSVTMPCIPREEPVCGITGIPVQLAASLAPDFTAELAIPTSIPAQIVCNLQCMPPCQQKCSYIRTNC